MMTRLVGVAAAMAPFAFALMRAVETERRDLRYLWIAIAAFAGAMARMVLAMLGGARPMTRAMLAAGVFVMSALSAVVAAVFDVSVAFGAIFAAVAAVLYVPAFAILQAVAGPRLRPGLAVSAGVLLAPAAALAFTMAFREAESPQTVSAQLGYWASHAPQVFMGVWPVLAAGGVFGLLWSRQPARDRGLARA